MEYVKLFEEFVNDVKTNQHLVKEADVITPGTRIKVKASGQLGYLNSWSEDIKKYNVSLDDSGQQQFNETEIEVIVNDDNNRLGAKTQKLVGESHLIPGSKVKCKADGLVGDIISWSEDTGKYLVQLENGKQAELTDDDVEAYIGDINASQNLEG